MRAFDCWDRGKYESDSPGLGLLKADVKRKNNKLCAGARGKIDRGGNGST